MFKVGPWDGLDEAGRSVVDAATADLRRVYRPRDPATPTGTRGECRRIAACGADGVIVGVAEWRVESDTLWVQGVAVERRSRRRGVARALLAHLAVEARTLGLDRLALATIGETGNVAVFTRLGFAETTRAHSARFEGIDGSPVTEVTLHRRLDGDPSRRH